MLISRPITNWVFCKILCFTCFKMIWAFWHVLIFRELSVYSFIHSGYFYSAFFKPTTTQRRSQLLSNRSRLLAHFHSLSRPPVSSSLKLCNGSLVYAASDLWNGLTKDIRQFAHPPSPPLKLTAPPLALNSATCSHDWIPNCSSYHIPALLLHHTSAISTDCNHSSTQYTFSTWPFRILIWHRNETINNYLAIADLIWYSAGEKAALPGVAFVSAEKFSKIYIFFTFTFAHFLR